MQDLPTTRPTTTFALLEGVGHCPQDDRPELLHAKLLPWLGEVFGGKRRVVAGAAVAAVEA